MAEIVTIDRSGRIVIPKPLRRELKLSDNSKLVLMRGTGGRLLLQKLDVEVIAAGLERELKGKDLDAIVKRVRKEVNEKIREAYPEISA
ncbi:MAG: AbrB/MazE/SpoVT family DNA-binding domain-containing protein [Candidatus Bathyarchaeia archaeon]